MANVVNKASSALVVIAIILCVSMLTPSWLLDQLASVLPAKIIGGVATPWVAQNISSSIATVFEISTSRAAGIPPSPVVAKVEGCGSRPANVYIDMGINWGQTIEKFIDFLPKFENPSTFRACRLVWDVYGFEMSPPLLRPLDRAFKWYSMGKPKDQHPELPWPPSGSSRDLLRHTQEIKCVSKSKIKNKDCVLGKLIPEVKKLFPSRTYSDKQVKERLQVQPRVSVGQGDTNSYTLIPAGVGTSSREINFSNSYASILIGGGKKPTVADDWSATARVIDVVSWLDSVVIGSSRRNTIGRLIFMKMDVEGAEREVVPSMLKHQQFRHIDLLAWECHLDREWCADHSKQIMSQNPKIILLSENKDYVGWMNNGEQTFNFKVGSKWLDQFQLGTL